MLKEEQEKETTIEYQVIQRERKLDFEEARRRADKICTNKKMKVG